MLDKLSALYEEIAANYEALSNRALAQCDYVNAAHWDMLARRYRREAIEVYGDEESPPPSMVQERDEDRETLDAVARFEEQQRED